MSSGPGLGRVLATAVAAVLVATGAAPAAEAGRTIVSARAFYPEGPLADGDGVTYAEMGADRVMRYDGKANRQIWNRPGCGPTSVASFGGDLLILCHIEGALARISRAGVTLAIIDRDRNGKSFITPNASINDGRGGVYFSSSGLFSPTAPAAGAVLYLDRTGTLSRLAEGIHYANGVALSHDGKTLYVSEHLERQVLAYDVAADATLSNRRVFVRLDDVEASVPGRSWEVGTDGLAMDAAGNLYIAEYGAGHLLIVGPDAKLRATIDVDEKYITAPALTPDETRIYITAPVSTYEPAAPGKVYSFANPVGPRG
jgi:gluconolactonase